MSILAYTIADKKSLRRFYTEQRAMNANVLANLKTQVERALDEDKPFLLYKIHAVEESQLAINSRLVQLNRELAQYKKDYPSQYTCSLD